MDVPSINLIGHDALLVCGDEPRWVPPQHVMTEILSDPQLAKLSPSVLAS